MSIPTLPTDSLYKFMSVAGIVTCVASVTLVFVAARYVLDERNVLLNAVDARSDQLLRLTIEIADVEFETAQQSAGWNESAKTAIASKISAMKLRANTIETEVIERRKGLQKNSENIMTSLGFCGNVAFGFGLFGAAVATLGFILWSCRIQSLEDAILHYQHDKLKQELACLPVSSTVSIPEAIG